MNTKRPTDLADTYILDDDVMDEMENFDATSVLEEDWRFSAAGTREKGFMDDIQSGTGVLDAYPHLKKH